MATGWGSFASFVVFIVLARLLDPAEFGTFALAQAAFQFFLTLVTSGFTDVAIQRSQLSEDLADTLFWSNLAIAFLASAMLIFGASSYAGALQAPAAGHVLSALAPALPIEALAAIHMARALKGFGHRVIALRTLTSTSLGGVLAITAAFMGAGVWSLVIQVWVTALLNVGFAWRAYPWRPRLRFSYSALAPVLPLYGSVVFTRLLASLMLRIPELVVGRVLGTASLGYYRVAWRLMDMISQTVLQPLGNVAFPALAHLQMDIRRFADAYTQLLGAGAIVTCPLFFGGGVLADALVPALFGHQWAESSLIVRLFPLLAGSTALNFLVSQAITAKGGARHLMVISFAQLGAIIITTLATVHFGLLAVSAGYIFRAYLMIPYQQRLLRRLCGISFFSCWSAIRTPLFASAAMAVLLYFLTPLLSLHLSSSLALLAAVCIGAAAYSLLLITFGRSFIFPYLLHARSLLTTTLPGRRPAPH